MSGGLGTRHSAVQVFDKEYAQCPRAGGVDNLNAFAVLADDASCVLPASYSVTTYSKIQKRRDDTTHTHTQSGGSNGHARRFRLYKVLVHVFRSTLHTFILYLFTRYGEHRRSRPTYVLVDDKVNTRNELRTSLLCCCYKYDIIPKNLTRCVQYIQQYPYRSN